MSGSEPIAIIGVACQFPGAGNLKEFWKLLSEGRDLISTISENRLENIESYDWSASEAGKTGGFLNQLSDVITKSKLFDASYSLDVDPQHQLLLHTVAQALNDVNLQSRKEELPTVGVFIGQTNLDYHRTIYRQLNTVVFDHVVCSAPCFAANRVSHYFGFTGPSITLDTACSSSLVAVHLACQSLRADDCGIAIAGGVNLLLSPAASISLSHGGFISPSGRCRVFDDAADGYVRGEGCGVVILKKLDVALEDENRVLGTILASAVNHNGNSGRLTSPNVAGQRSVITKTIKRAAVEPSAIGFVETHAVGTKLGDYFELKALADVFWGRETSRSVPLLVGSVKTNIGHLEAAAGIAGLIKILVSMEHGRIPPHLHLQKLNQLIARRKWPISIPTSLEQWPFRNGTRKLAGVSAFGFGGTNCHVIVSHDSANASQ